MTLRKRRQPTPDFRLPPPYQPITGKRAPLISEGVYPYCAMMQVAAEDDHEHYVICRGFDTRIRRFIDYAEGDENSPGIAVAKPFGRRFICQYHIGEVFPVFLPLQTGNPSPVDVPYRVGQNPGAAEAVCRGQPQSLDDEIEELYDDNGKAVNWMLIDSAPTLIWAKLLGALYPCGQAQAKILVLDEDGEFCDYCDDITASDPHAVSALLADGYAKSGYHVLLMAAAGSVEGSSSSSGDNCMWVAVAFGTDECCEGSSSSESSESESESSSSSSSESSESESEGKEAIVPATWTPGGYTGLFIVEAPDVRFEDVLKVMVETREQFVNIDPRFVEVCAENTIEVIGCVPSEPVVVGASVDNGCRIRVRFGPTDVRETTLVFKLSGIRRGFIGRRFPNHTREQFEANERFIRRAFSGGL